MFHSSTLKSFEHHNQDFMNINTQELVCLNRLH